VMAKPTASLLPESERKKVSPIWPLGRLTSDGSGGSLCRGRRYSRVRERKPARPEELCPLTMGNLMITAAVLSLQRTGPSHPAVAGHRWRWCPAVRTAAPRPRSASPPNSSRRPVRG
jgi:hypothetical protein